MRQQIVQEIRDSLNRMEDTGKVDMSILNSLEKLRQLVYKIQSKWLEHPNTDAFYFYQAVRNIELIVGMMEDRFKNSKETNDNPKVAKDSLIMMPIISDILHMTEKCKISDSSINEILDKTMRLRNTAASTNLIEPLSADYDAIDKDTLQYRFVPLMNRLGIKPDDEYVIEDV